jgi:hypothetical protein
MTTSVLFVTAYKDIGRGNWIGFERSTDDYINMFKNLIGLKDLICFCEPEIQEKLGDIGYNKCFPYEAEKTFFQIEAQQQAILNEQKRTQATGGRTDPECLYASYTIVNHNKALFLARAKQMFPNFSHYAWIDFGYQRKPLQSLHFDFSNLPSNSITVPAFSNPSLQTIPTAVDNLKLHRVIIQGSLYFVPKALIDWYCSAYTKIVLEYQNQCLADDDQALVLQLYKQNPEKFSLRLGDWFKLLETFHVIHPVAKDRFDVLLPHIQSIKGVCVEIGVYEGKFTKFLLENTKDTHVYCIDPYKKFPSDDYMDAINDRSQEEYDSLYKRVKKEITDAYPGRVTFVRSLSSDASQFFPDKSLAFVYVDGNHCYESAKEDFEKWLPKIQSGGLLVGDDACDTDEVKRDQNKNVRVDWGPGCYGYYGVKKAAQDVFQGKEQILPFFQVLVKL